jgi:hypothetical protein
MIEISKTQRGFLTTNEFVDSRQNHIQVSQSSAASARYAWVFIRNNGECGDDFKGEVSLHLNKKQAKKLITRLVAILGKEILNEVEDD